MSVNWEWYLIGIVVAWTLLFPAGGTEVPATKRGYKWLRRYIAPALSLLFLILIDSVALWRSILCCCALCGLMHLGYGNGKSWGYRAIVGLLYALPSLFLGFSFWFFLLPVGFITLFAVSMWKPTAKMFPWVLVCAIDGALIGASLAGAVVNCWWCK